MKDSHLSFTWFSNLVQLSEKVYRASSPKAFAPKWDSHHEDVRVQAKYSFRSVVVLIGCVKSIKVKNYETSSDFVGLGRLISFGLDLVRV